jgi:ubiquinone/menaquinone biosynthesis C-methylase UbiE
MTEAMEAEFDTVAEWTAEAAVELGPEYYVPAGCRGSGSPAALDWLIERMGLEPGWTLLDSGAGVGGPAAYVTQSRSLSTILVEPEHGACRAAKKLFGYPVLRASGSRLPIRDSSVDAVWSLGVLCTTPDQRAMLEEMRRIVRPGGPIGMLTFVARAHIPDDQLEGNHFPTPDGLAELVREVALRIEGQRSTADLPAIPDEWTARTEAVDEVLNRKYGQTKAWQLAERQSATIGRLLGNGSLSGELLVLRDE